MAPYSRPARAGEAGTGMEILRIGEKLIDEGRVVRAVRQALHLRAAGRSQQEVAEALALDRSFISRLESLGEVRKGRRIALIGFPVENREELLAMAREEGVEFTLLLSNEQRWSLVREQTGEQLFNFVTDLIARARAFDTVIFLGSDMRIRMAESILGERVVGVELGPSPLTQDCHVDPALLRALIADIRERRGRAEARRQR